MNQDTLKSAFWDFPQFAYKKKLHEVLESEQGIDLNDWILIRLLEFGRVVDTLEFFTIADIKKRLPGFKLRRVTFQKWTRLIEVYDRD